MSCFFCLICVLVLSNGASGNVFRACVFILRADGKGLAFLRRFLRVRKERGKMHFRNLAGSDQVVTDYQRLELVALKRDADVSSRLFRRHFGELLGGSETVVRGGAVVGRPLRVLGGVKDRRGDLILKANVVAWVVRGGATVTQVGSWERVVRGRRLQVLYRSRSRYRLQALSIQRS